MGVGVNVGEGVNVVVAVAGSGGVWIVAVGVDSSKGVGAALWQAVMRMKHPIRSFFMTLLITQMPHRGALRLDICA